MLWITKKKIKRAKSKTYIMENAKMKVANAKIKGL